MFIAHTWGDYSLSSFSAPRAESTPLVSGHPGSDAGGCFIATPHIGADLAKWATYFGTVLGTNVAIRTPASRAAPAGPERVVSATS